MFYDPEGREGRLWFLRGSVRDGHGDVVGERLFAVFEGAAGGLEQWPLTALLDLEGAPSSTALEETRLDEGAADDTMPEARERVIDWSLDHCVDPYFEELSERRTREAEIKQRYLKKSFNARISASMKKIGQHKRREQTGADMEMAIRQEQMRKDELIEKRERRLAEVTSERYLSRRTPEVVGVAAVVPQPREREEERGGMRSSEEIERIAMEVAMAHERQRGWRPEDVSEENLGFDVRSHEPDGEVRRIEVKGRAGEGAVRLSPNEWLKAQQLGETFWLYIVVDCASEPRLWVMQNPASRLEPEEEIQVTSYRVEHGAWRAVAERRDTIYEIGGDCRSG